MMKQQKQNKPEKDRRKTYVYKKTTEKDRYGGSVTALIWRRRGREMDEEEVSDEQRPQVDGNFDKNRRFGSFLFSGPSDRRVLVSHLAASLRSCSCLMRSCFLSLKALRTV